MSRSFAALLAPFIIVLATVLNSTDVRAGELCTNASVIFARGSGANLNGDEYTAWRKSFDRHQLNDRITHYELGTESINGHRYSAVNVARLWNGNALGASVSGGLGNDYGRSVSDGVEELTGYITKTSQACPQMRYILGGYSQGAQVITQALRKMAPNYRESILFVATFGDPKLRLPEGDGVFYVPACDGKSLSPWRRIVDNCRTSHGSLLGWNPYVPDDMRQKVWAWCYAKDFVCGGDWNPLETSGHMRYKDPGMGIDDAVNEASKRFNEYIQVADPLAPHSPSTNPIGVQKPNDIALVIDTTGSMGSQIDATKYLAVDIAQKIIEKGGRVALTEYRDSGDAVEAAVRCDLTQDIGKFTASVNDLSVDGGGDRPEGLLHALMTTYNTLDWKQGAAKAVVVITDDAYHDPDIIDNSTLNDVVKRSLEIDPVNTYMIVPEEYVDTYRSLAEATAGKVLVDSGDTVAVLLGALDQVLSRPFAQLPLIGYEGAVGTEFKFDASMSAVDGSTIKAYEWDFNGDGVFERTTITPVTYYTYPGQFEGSMQVKVSTASGASSSASATVHVGAPTQVPPLATIEQFTVTPNGSDAFLSWKIPTGSTATRWQVMFNGVPLGYAVRDQTTLEIQGIDRSIETEYAIRAADESGRVSDWTVATLPIVQREVDKASANRLVDNSYPPSSNAKVLSKAMSRYEQEGEARNVDSVSRSDALSFFAKPGTTVPATSTGPHSSRGSLLIPALIGGVILVIAVGLGMWCYRSRLKVSSK